METTTIQVSLPLLEELKNHKMFDRETYEEVVWDLIEDSLELSQETLEAVEKARKGIAAGNFYTHEQVKKELGLL